jgi:hypothetical protein
MIIVATNDAVTATAMIVLELDALGDAGMNPGV